MRQAIVGVFPGGFRSHLDADASVGVNQRPEPLRRAGDAHVRSGVEVSDTRAGRSEAEGLAGAKLVRKLAILVFCRPRKIIFVSRQGARWLGAP